MTEPREDPLLSSSPPENSESEPARRHTSVMPDTERHGTAVLPEADTFSDFEQPPAPLTGFIDPHPLLTDSEPAKDRVWPHFCWEFLLAVAIVITCWQIRQDHPRAFEISSDNELWLSLAVVTLFATAFAFSLRVGVANLAIPSIGATSLLGTYWLMTRHEFGWFLALVVVLACAVVFGLLLGLFVVALHVPGWAATLGAAVLCVGIAASLREGFSVTRSSDVADLPDAARHGWVLFAVVVLASIGGGAVWLFDRVRNRWSIREDADAAKRPHAGGGLISVVALTASSTMAALAGVLAGMAPDSSLSLVGVSSSEFVRVDEDTFLEPGQAVTVSAGLDSGAVLTASLATLSLLAVLVGGVSVFGRRGGLFGTVLATVLLTLLCLVVLTDFDEQWLYYFAGGVVLAGLIVSRLVETWTRPRSA